MEPTKSRVSIIHNIFTNNKKKMLGKKSKICIFDFLVNIC